MLILKDFQAKTGNVCLQIAVVLSVVLIW